MWWCTKIDQYQVWCLCCWFVVSKKKSALTPTPICYHSIFIRNRNLTANVTGDSILNFAGGKETHHFVLPFARWYTPLGRLLLTLEQITHLGSAFGGQLQTLRGHYWVQISRNHLYVWTSWAGQSVWQRPVRGSIAFRPLRPFNDSLFDRYVREINFLQQFDSWKWIVRGNNNNNRRNPILFLLLPQLTTKNLQIIVKIQMFHIIC